MIYTLTLNPSLDYIVHVDGFRTDHTNRTKAERILPGGKGINVSIVLGNLGIPSTALGFIAGFTGEELVRMVTEKQVVSDFIRVTDGMTRINVKLKSDEETEINGRGPVITAADIDALYGQLEQLREGDILVISGSVPSAMPDDTYCRILQKLQNRGILYAVDAEGELLLKVLPYHPFLIKPNHHELGALFSTEITTVEEAAAGAYKLQEMGARNVLVSMGASGAVLVSENIEVIHGPAPQGKPVNSVGAGDSMVAGFLAGYLKTHDYREALALGICAGSASAFHEDLASGKEIYALRETYSLPHQG